jgi:NHLM bacteriocin system ABC transporter peptidase/ATP-binding protein
MTKDPFADSSQEHHLNSRLTEWERRIVRERGRVKTTSVLQMEAVECGAASLAIVLQYYGRILPLEQLRIDCGVSRDGSNANNLLEAARKYGLKAKGYRMGIERLKRLAMPAIVFWNFEHFLVVEGFVKDRVFLNDPAMGPRIVSDQEFFDSYTGVALAFEPGPDFQKGGKKHSLFGLLKQWLASSNQGLIFVVLTTLALVIPGLLIPALSRVFIDEILVAGNDNLLAPLLFGLLLTAAMRGVFLWLQQRYLLRLETKLALANASKFMTHVLLLPAHFFTQRHAGDVGYRFQINDRVAQLLSGEMATALVDLLLIIFFAIVLFLIDPILTVIGIFIALLNLLTLFLLARRRTDVSSRLQQERGKLHTASVGGLQRIETLKVIGGEAGFFSRWSGYQAKAINAEQQLGASTHMLMALPPLLVAINNVLILTLGGLQVMNGVMTVGDLVAFLSLMASMMGPINRMVGLGSLLQETEADMTRLNDILFYTPDPQARLSQSAEEDNDGATKLSGHVEVRNVNFGYSPVSPPLIENLNLILEPGARVALVGATGSGKSTIARLLSGLYDPWEGEILFDGQSRHGLARELITHSLAMVDQDIVMFRGTLRDNLTLWDKSVPEKSILQAARDALIHDDILDRPGGYDAMVEESGHNFSGGQRQRLEIARALVSNPTILVLDEATSALDVVTEQGIDENLRRRGCTCIIVAHRLSTIRDCDEIIVLEQGQVVQRGTHEKMMGMDGPYARLISAY